MTEFESNRRKGKGTFLDRKRVPLLVKKGIYNQDRDKRDAYPLGNNIHIKRKIPGHKSSETGINEN